MVIQHGHLAQYGEFLHSVDLFGATSIHDVYARLATYLSEHEGVRGKNDWVRGVGWDQMALGGMPTAVCCSSSEPPFPWRLQFLSHGRAMVVNIPTDWLPRKGNAGE